MRKSEADRLTAYKRGQEFGEFGDSPRILAETPVFKGEYLGLAPNSLTPPRNENLCILVCCLLSGVSFFS